MRKETRQYNVDWKKNNKIALRNFNESIDHHDMVKLILVRILRREHNKSYKVPIYTEFNPSAPNIDYPDIWMKINGDIIVWEIQKNLTKEWEKKIIERYKDVDLIIVPLEKLSKELEELKKQLKEYIV